MNDSAPSFCFQVDRDNELVTVALRRNTVRDRRGETAASRVSSAAHSLNLDDSRREIAEILRA